MKFDSTDAVISKNISEGLSVGDIVDDIIAEQLSPGMRNVICRTISPKYTCPWCGFPIPKYPGRYPKKCPECGSLLDPSDQEGK